MKNYLFSLLCLLYICCNSQNKTSKKNIENKIKSINVSNNNNNNLDALKGSFVKIDFINEKPYVIYNYINKSTEDIALYGIETKVHLKDDINSGWNCSYGSNPNNSLLAGDSVQIICEVRNIDFKKNTLPITNPDDYNLVVSSICSMIKINEKTYYRD